MIQGIDNKYRKIFAPQENDRDFLGFHSNCMCQQHPQTVCHISSKVEQISSVFFLHYFPYVGIQLLNAKSGPRLIIH